MASPPSRPLLKQRFERRRAEVLDAAAAVFARKGYSGAGIEDLSAATGLAAGGLYHYIGSKEAALFAVLQDLMEPLLGQAAAVERSGSPPAEQLRALIRIWVRHVADHRNHMLVFNQERHLLESDPEHWQEIRGPRREFEQILDRLLGRCAAAAGDTHTDLRLMRFALLGMVNHTAQWIRPDGRLAPEEIADGYADLILNQIANRPPATD